MKLSIPLLHSHVSTIVLTFNPLPPLPSLFLRHLSPAGLDFVKSMLSLNPKGRLSASTLLEHPWLKEESPAPSDPSSIPGIEGDWHEFEMKQLRKQQHQAHRSKPA